MQGQVSDSRLVYIGSADDVRDVTGVTIRNMFLNGAGGECVRLRNNAHGNTITDSVVQYCGMYGKGGDDDRTEYHNGEGIYIGTSPKSDDQPMYDNDTSSDNVITNNVIRTFGSECFNVKENAHNNLFEGNMCSDNAESDDFDGSNVELRGHDNVVRGNVISDSAGYGVKIQSDEEQYDLGGNTVENNRITGTEAEPLKIKISSHAGPDLRQRGHRRGRGHRDRGLHRRPDRPLPDRRHGPRAQLTALPDGQRWPGRLSRRDSSATSSSTSAAPMPSSHTSLAIGGALLGRAAVRRACPGVRR